MDYEEFLELVKMRRSVRAFTDEPVPDEVVDRVIEAARWAPSGANSQPWEFIVIRDQATKDQMAVWARELQEMFHQAELTRPAELRWPSAARPVSDAVFKTSPVLILVVGDPRVSKSFPLLTYVERQEANLVSALASAFLYMTLAATSLGLGSHWASLVGSAYPSTMIRDLLGIPDEYRIYDMLGLGYPAMEPKPRLVRDRQAMTHLERFDQTKYRTDEQIREWLISLRK
jgi:5,6-dimethylbenzimidazole synthase